MNPADSRDELRAALERLVEAAESLMREAETPLHDGIGWSAGFLDTGRRIAEARSLLATPAPTASLDALAAEIAKDWNGRELDTAWAAAEAALPEGWVLEAHGRPDGGHAEAWNFDSGVSAGFVEASGPTPAAALLALAERLREQSS